MNDETKTAPTEHSLAPETRESLVADILRLKRERHAIILAHVYQPAEIQAIADYSGDSFALSQKAAQTDAEVIVFCGVRFMAETANILSPDKITLLPAANASCRMFDDTITSKVEKAKAEHPDATVVAYVNTPAAVKGMSDICCTSSNAAAVVASIPQGTDIIFVPDGNLGQYAMEQSGRHVLPWQGGCPIHGALTPADIEDAKRRHPEALVLLHPECRKAVRDMADYVGSTTGIIKYAEHSDKKQFIIATECGVLYELKRCCPDKQFFMANDHLVCQDMKYTHLEDVRQALLTLEPRVIVPDAIREKAVNALNKMLSIKG